MMLLLADNAVAQGKSRGSWVPRLRAAFHVGEHYEFQQIEGVNPTRFSYIVGQVTVDLARLVDQALRARSSSATSPRRSPTSPAGPWPRGTRSTSSRTPPPRSPS
jgi:hypothetical protein